MRAFYCCTVCILVIDAEKVDRCGQPILYLEGQNGGIGRDHQGEAATRRGAYTRRCSTREACEPAQWTGSGRACARAHSMGTQPRKTSSAKIPTTRAKAAAPVRGRGRRATTTAKPAGGKRSSSNLSDQVFALATGKTQQEITAACKNARPNHVGAAIARHKRAGRVEERDGKLYAIQPTGTEQRVAV